MAYSGSKISTGRINEDRCRITDNLDRIFGESPTERMIRERENEVLSPIQELKQEKI